MSPLTPEQEAWMQEAVSKAVRPLAEEVVALRAENKRLRKTIDTVRMIEELRSALRH